MFSAGQAIVKTEHLNQLNAPGCLHVIKIRSRDCHYGGFAFLFSPVFEEKDNKGGRDEALYLFCTD